jgi:hypothetical protein
MELRLRVETLSDSYEVTTTPWVIMLWERKYKTKASKIQTDGLGLEDLAYIAYEAGKMSGNVSGKTFDQFAQEIKNLDVLEGDTADPIQAVASDD